MQTFTILFAIIVVKVSASIYHPFVENNFDFVGNDIANVHGDAVDKCTDLCEATPRCVAYSWSNYKNGTCWLKSARDKIVAKYGVISSYMWKESAQICQSLNDIDFVGNDVGSAPATDAAQCCYICSKTFNCRSYSWSNYNSGMCWLKSGRGIAIVKKGIVSADLYPNDATMQVLHYDIDYTNHDITNRPSSTPEGCFDICKSITTCRAFSWTLYQGGTCWLKDGKDQEINKQGVVSATLF